MIFELLILELLLLSLATSLGTYMSEAKNSSSPLIYTNIPYPFGRSGEAMKGFEISCNGTSPILQLGNNIFEIEDISLLQGNLSIYTGVIIQNCDHFSSTGGSGWMDLEGTPCTISDTQNMLTTVSCGEMVHIQGLGGTLSTTCSTFCNSTHDTHNIVNGSCSGLGCCQTPIPKDLKSFNLTLGSVGKVRRIPPPSRYHNYLHALCSQAFFVKQSNFTFSSEMLKDVLSGRSSQDS